MHTFRFVASLAVLVLATGSAWAAPAIGGGTGGARAYFNAGARAYASAKYAEAVRAFEAAYRVEPRPGLLFSIAQAYRRQYFVGGDADNLREAIVHYRRYLEAEPEGNRRGDSAAALSELEPIVARLGPASVVQRQDDGQATQLMISSAVEDVSLSLDGNASGKLPYIAPVAPGEHRVRLTREGYLPYERVIRVLEGSVVPLDVALEEMPGKVTVRTSEGARVAVDGRSRGTAPLGPIDVAPGAHLISVTLNGNRAFSREVTVRRAGKITVEADLEASGQRAASWLLLGAGGATLLAGGGLLGLAWREDSRGSELLQRRAQGTLTAGQLRQYERIRTDRDALRTAGIVTAAAGLSVTAVGLVLFAFDEPRADGERDERRGPASPLEERGGQIELALGAPGTAAPGGTVRGTF